MNFDPVLLILGLLLIGALSCMYIYGLYRAYLWVKGKVDHKRHRRYFDKHKFNELEMRLDKTCDTLAFVESEVVALKAVDAERQTVVKELQGQIGVLNTNSAKWLTAAYQLQNELKELYDQKS